MKIQEGNKLIAEFMGYKFDPNKKDGSPFYKEFKDGAWESKNYFNPLYHVSWDWLMPVVEKIEQGNYGIKQCRKVVEIYFDDTKEVILKTKEKSRIESLWAAITQFILWYNTNNPKTPPHAK